MRISPALPLFLFAFVLSISASASDFYPVTEADKKFLGEVVDALTRKDAAWIADHMVYPLSIVANDRKRVVKSKRRFVAIVRREFAGGVGARIAEAAKAPLFKNWQGVMVGDGILWFERYQIGRKSPWRYGIFAIGHFAYQPAESLKITAGPN